MLAAMAGALRHRGPDGYGFYRGPGMGLAHTRLSIIDRDTGAQPITNEDGNLLVVFNGEIFNYIELRAELRALHHRFKTQSDTEVLVHGFEEWGEALLPRLNGDFAFAILDKRAQTVFLARDRFGVRPLFVAQVPGGICFASEVKALFASGLVVPRADYHGLAEVFTFWAALPPRTVFQGVRAVEPGCWLRFHLEKLRGGRYYEFRFEEAAGEPADAVEALDALLADDVRIRMRSDVPVGGYLSGGLDSSIACALAARVSPYQLRTFSVAFDDPAFDERAHQELVARELGSRHTAQSIGPGAIASVFPDVVWHTETPIVRTAPAPLFLLSKLTRENGVTVVLTGEGADELFLGYDLFKETVVRLFCLRQPGSRVRPRLFDRLYPYLDRPARGGDVWRRFFLDAGLPEDPLFSHLPRFRLTARIEEFYSADMKAEVGTYDPMGALRDRLPPSFRDWSPVNRAAYLELVTLLAPYLLSSQGDRMAMAHGVEGRFPFLDHRLFEFAALLPERTKLRGLREKDILRRWAIGRVPRAARERPKQPYRAPDSPSFFGAAVPEWVGDVLSDTAVRSVGLFDPRFVARLVDRCRTGLARHVRENQAFVAVLSTQIWHTLLGQGAKRAGPVRIVAADVVIDDTEEPMLTSQGAVHVRG
jgi:asparagine synthase (glutamine-hydrolysing)